MMIPENFEITVRAYKNKTTKASQRYEVMPVLL